MFGKEQLGYFLPLALFANMSSLNICGGDFYSDKLIDLLELIGQGEMHWKPKIYLNLQANGWRSWTFMRWVSLT